MDRIGREIERELGRFAGQPSGQLAAIVEGWSAAVGETIAVNAWPARVARDGTLQVHTSSSTWAFELGQLSTDVLGRLREKLGESAPKAIRFAPGHLPEAAPEPGAQTAAKVPAPGPKETARAAELAAAIEDEELREKVARAAALSLANAASAGGF
jgi:hypothetical protein